MEWAGAGERFGREWEKCAQWVVARNLGEVRVCPWVATDGGLSTPMSEVELGAVQNMLSSGRGGFGAESTWARHWPRTLLEFLFEPGVLGRGLCRGFGRSLCKWGGHATADD